jgi:hypothetical protein
VLKARQDALDDAEEKLAGDQAALKQANEDAKGLDVVALRNHLVMIRKDAELLLSAKNKAHVDSLKYDYDRATKAKNDAKDEWDKALQPDKDGKINEAKADAAYEKYVAAQNEETDRKKLYDAAKTKLDNAQKEYDTAVKGINELGGITNENSDDVKDAKTVTVYRLYNKYTGEHLYTTNESEKDMDVKAGWTDEGAVWESPSEAGKTSVYRLYNRWEDAHIYTTDLTEYNNLQDLGWKGEGRVFYSSEDKDAKEVYRLYNKYNGRHLFTVNADEAKTTEDAGWTLEGKPFKVNGLAK